MIQDKIIAPRFPGLPPADITLVRWSWFVCGGYIISVSHGLFSKHKCPPLFNFGWYQPRNYLYRKSGNTDFPLHNLKFAESIGGPVHDRLSYRYLSCSYHAYGDHADRGTLPRSPKYDRRGVRFGRGVHCHDFRRCCSVGYSVAPYGAGV